MIEVKTTKRWQKTFDPVVAYLKSVTQVAGVLVADADDAADEQGSGAHFLVALQADADIKAVVTDWKTQVETVSTVLFSFDVIYQEHEHLYLALLEKDVCLSLTFLSIDRIKADTRRWEMVFDPSGKLEAVIQPNLPVSSKASIYLRLSHRLWRQVMHVVIALRGEQLWRAVYELEQIRHAVVELASIRHNLVMNGYQEVDQLPEMFLIRLRQTMPSSFSSSAIKRAVRFAVSTFFGEADVLDSEIPAGEVSDIERRIQLFMDSYL